MTPSPLAAANLYWDRSAVAGYQAGDGVWSLDAADTNWSPNGVAIAAFANNDVAFFGDNDGGTSVVRMTGVFSNTSAIVHGSHYQIFMMTGAQLTCTYNLGADFYLGRGTNYGSSASNIWWVLGGDAAVTTRLVTSRTGGATMHVGGTGLGAVSNVLIVDAGGVEGSALVTNSGGTVVGASGAWACGIQVRNGGHFINSAGSVQIGTAGSTQCFFRADQAYIRTGGLQLYGDMASVAWVNGSRYVDGGSFVSLIVGSGGWATQCSMVIDQSWVYHNGSGDFKITGEGGWGVVTNGGYLSLAGGNNRYVGETATGCQFTVVGGGGTSSVVDLGANVLTVGVTGGKSNTVWIDGAGVAGGAVVTNGRVTIGSGATSSGNRLIITNGGTFYMSSGAGYVGSSSPDNRAEVVGGAGPGTLWNGGNQILYVGNQTGGDNALVIDGRGELGSAIVTNIRSLAVGRGDAAHARDNAVIVTNGGVLYLGTGNNWGQGGDSHVVGLSENHVGSYATSNRIEVVQGGRVYSAGHLFVGYIDYNGAVVGTRLVVRDADSVLDMGGKSINAPYCYAANAVATSGVEVLIDAGLVTNVASFVMPNRGAGYDLHDNRLVVTNGGRLYVRATSSIGGTGGSNNLAVVTGPGSMWDLGGNNLSIGATAHADNGLIIDQTGTVDNVGTLSLYTNNFIQLRGGLLGMANTVGSTNPMVIGDGAQKAILKALGGTLLFTNGLWVGPEAEVTGIGAFSGGSVGLHLTNGGTLNPGVDGAGSLTIGGTGLLWESEGVFRCELTNLNLGPGLGWDYVWVSTQLALSATTPKPVIKIDSRGGAAAHFVPGADYNVRILSYGTAPGLTVDGIDLDASDFLPASVWTLTNVMNDLYLIYRGGDSPPEPDYTWNAPNSGNWDVPGNWTNGLSPLSGGGSDLCLAFGDTGVRYAATNNLGEFFLNRMHFMSVSGVTNVLAGSKWVFTNEGATLPRMDFLSGAGSFLISNAMVVATDMIVSGNAYVGGTIRLAGALTNDGTLTKRGTWTLALSNANNQFNGPLVVDSPDGILQVDHVGALNGSGAVVISNGLLWVNQGNVNYYFANGRHHRQGRVEGVGSIWSNRASVANTQSGYALGATNVQFVVSGGRHYWTVRLHAFNTGSQAGLLTVTNGGQLLASTYGAWMAYQATQCVVRLTGEGSTYNGGGQGFVVSESGSSNEVWIDQQSLLTNIAGLTVGSGVGTGNSLTVTNGGRLFTGTSPVHVGNLSGSQGNRLTVTGPGSFWYAAGNAVYIGQAGTTNNALIVNQGAVASNIRAIISSGYSNRIEISSGGRLIGYGNEQYIGYGAQAAFNTLTLEGADSLYNANGQHFYVATGNTNLSNHLYVGVGGLFTNANTLFVVAGIDSVDNRVTVEGGRLQATALAFNNLMTNRFVLTGGGEATFTRFTVSNVNQRVEIQGGVLRVQTALVTNGVPFVVGDGVQSATFLQLPSANPSRFYDGLVITNEAALAGQGMLMATTTLWGALSPGVTIGALTNVGDVILTDGSKSVFEIVTGTVAGVGWDLLVVTNGSLTLGGQLKPVLPGAFRPTESQQFVVMTNAGPASVVGQFANGTDGAIVYAYSNDLTRIVGAFRLGINNQSVVLSDFAAGSLERGTIFSCF